MNRDELRGLLNNLRNERFMSKIIDDVAKAARAAGNMGWFDFIEMEILKHHEVIPKLNVVPPKKRILLDDFLDEAYGYVLKGAFNHRDNPDLFEAYSSPFSDKRGKYLDEMTAGQRTVIAMMHEDIVAFKKKEKQKADLFGQPNQSDIEQALNNAIRKKARETSKDTPE